MKKILFFLLLSSPLYAEGPNFTQSDTFVQQEFDNVYQDLRKKISDPINVASGTIRFLNTSTITANKVTVTGPGTNPVTITDASSYTINIGSNSTGTGGRITTLGGSAVLDLGTNQITAISIKGSGQEVTQPLQPCFLATDGTGATNVTGDGTTYSELWPTEVFDQGNDFASNTFTAPVDGKYLLSVNLDYTDTNATHALRSLTIVTSNRSYSHSDSYALAESARTLSLCVLADMDANDTATVTIRITNSTKTVSVAGSAVANTFSGSLIN